MLDRGRLVSPGRPARVIASSTPTTAPTTTASATRISHEISANVTPIRPYRCAFTATM